MTHHNRRERPLGEQRLPLAVLVTAALASLAACSSQDKQDNNGAGGSGAGAGTGGEVGVGGNGAAIRGTGGTDIFCSDAGGGSTPMCGGSCLDACGCRSCAPGTRSGDLVCAQPGCYLNVPLVDVGVPTDASVDAQASGQVCGTVGHPCGADEICYATTEVGGLDYSCIKFASLCGTDTPGCGCLHSLCFHGTGECSNVKPGLVFCSSEGPAGTP